MINEKWLMMLGKSETKTSFIPLFTSFQTIFEIGKRCRGKLNFLIYFTVSFQFIYQLSISLLKVRKVKRIALGKKIKQ